MTTWACSACGAPVQWVMTERGTVLMLDVTPNRAGNIAVADGIAYVVGAEREPPPARAPRYFHHMRTCRVMLRKSRKRQP